MLAATTTAQKTIDEVYQPLLTGAKQIRLFTLQPALKIATPPVGIIDTVWLNDSPDYEAVSWFWGKRPFTGSTVLNGGNVQIPQNLEDALRHFRLCDRPRVLWVDAICVNQAETLEREEQVKLMGLIYQNARRTLVWLGLMNSPSRRFAYDSWNRIGRGITIRQLILEEAGRWSSTDQCPDSELDTRLAELDSDDGSHQVDLATKLCQFFEYEWWGRLWVLQEVALASEVRIFVGSHWMDLTHLISACRRLWNEFRDRQTDLDGILGSDNRQYLIAMSKRGMDTIQQISRIRERILSIVPAVSSRDASLLMIEVLARSRHRDATIPHDKIYGLLGLIPPNLLRYFPLNYNQAVGEFFCTVAFQLLDLSKSFLIFNCIREKSDLVPSWCPDWSYAYLQRQDFCLRAEQEVLFQACGTVPWHVSILKRYPRTPILEVQGFRLDIIRRVEESRDDLMDAGGLFAYLELCLKCVDRKSSLDERDSFPLHHDLDGVGHAKYITGISILEAVTRTAFNDCEPIDHDYQIRRLNNNNQHQFEEWLGTIDSHSGMTGFDQDVINASEVMSFGGLAKRSMCQFARSVLNGKSFFTTRLGYAGLFDDQNHDETGGEVWILAGGSQPVVLEPDPCVPGGYHVCSEAYVHGVMDGEATRGEVPILPESGHPEAIFEKLQNDRSSWPSPVFKTIYLL